MLSDQLKSDQSRDLLSAIDKMREILHGENITLPEIVVVGDQSVGKSSVLEAISGIQLPRAQNICTRCPLELRIKTAQNVEFAVIRGSGANTTDTRIDDFSRIADEVSRLTTTIAGNGTNVSSNPIYLTVYKADVPYDLTLIDLPGITRNPLPGQQSNIHEQILDLINKYIEPPTAIVLHVIPASVDFTTSESMKLAKVFDPECHRQLIAVSKIDKYDKGIAEKLQGHGPDSMALRLGCVAVLNRNQEEIDQNISFEEMRHREKRFFIDHKGAFEHLPDEFKGSEQLVKRLATIQQERIRSMLPQIIKDLRKGITEKTLELKKIPVCMNTESECWTFFQTSVNTYREIVHDYVKGEYDQIMAIDTSHMTVNQTNNRLNTTADHEPIESSVYDENCNEDHIAYHVYHLQRRFQKKCRASFTDFFSSSYHRIVLREIDRTAGVSLPNFPSYQIIVGLFRRELQKLPDCCSILVEQIHEYLSNCLLRIFDNTFTNSYLRLKERLTQIIITRLNQAKTIVSDRIQEILNMERRVYTLNHYYMDTVNKIKEKRKREADDSEETVTVATNGSTGFINSGSQIGTYESVSNEAQAAEDIQIALHAYCKVVEKRVTDTVTQTCYHHFITECALKLDQILSASIPSSELVQYMREPYSQTNLRNKLTRTIQAYKDALELGLKHL